MTSNAIELHAPAALAIRPGQQMWSDKQVAALAVLGIKGATKADLAVFMHYCQKTGLDPFSRQIYGIMRREKSGGEWVDKFTIQVGIDGFRVIRDRVAERLGVTVEYEDTIWYDADGGEHKIWLWEDPPAGCNVTVVKGGRRFPGVLRFDSYAARNRDGDLVSQWKTQPDHMIEKCAEAFALRRAFPNDLAGVRLEDEMPPAEVNGAAPPRGRVTVAEVIERGPAEPQDEPKPAAQKARRKTAAAGGGTRSQPRDGAQDGGAPPREADEHGADPAPEAAGRAPSRDAQPLPPLPEDKEPAEDQPGSASKDQLTRLHTILTGLGFGGEDREQKLTVAEVITGRAPLTGPKQGRSSGNLSFTEAAGLIAKLDEFTDENGERDRDALIAFMAEREVAGDGDA